MWEKVLVLRMYLRVKGKYVCKLTFKCLKKKIIWIFKIKCADKEWMKEQMRQNVDSWWIWGKAIWSSLHYFSNLSGSLNDTKLKQQNRGEFPLCGFLLGLWSRQGATTIKEGGLGRVGKIWGHQRMRWSGEQRTGEEQRWGKLGRWPGGVSGHHTWWDNIRCLWRKRAGQSSGSCSFSFMRERTFIQEESRGKGLVIILCVAPTLGSVGKLGRTRTWEWPTMMGRSSLSQGCHPKASHPDGTFSGPPCPHYVQIWGTYMHIGFDSVTGKPANFVGSRIPALKSQEGKTQRGYRHSCVYVCVLIFYLVATLSIYLSVACRTMTHGVPATINFLGRQPAQKGQASPRNPHVYHPSQRLPPDQPPLPESLLGTAYAHDTTLRSFSIIPTAQPVPPTSSVQPQPW